jgi:hypothetical protein
MDKYKRIEGNEPYYTDTDSVFLAKPLDKNLVSSQIGSMKLEALIKEATFIGPKTYGYLKTFLGPKLYGIYGYLNEFDKESIKIKGFNSKYIKYTDLKELLFKDTTKYYPITIFKNTEKYNISLQEITKKLSNTIKNKRVPIFNEQNLLINTKPINITINSNHDNITINSNIDNKRISSNNIL